MDLNGEALGHLFTREGALYFRKHGVTAEHFGLDWERAAAEVYFQEAARGITLTLGDMRMKGYLKIPDKVESSKEYVAEQLIERKAFNEIKGWIKEGLTLLEKERKAQPVLDAMVKGLREIYEHGMKGQEIVNLLDMRDAVVEQYQKTKEGVRGIALPWPALTAQLMGLFGGDLGVIVARTGIGKTFVLLLILLQAWRDGYKPLLVITEMTVLKIAFRLFSMMLHIESQRMRTAQLTQEEEAKLYKGFIALDNAMPIPVAGGSGMITTLESIESSIIVEEPDLVLVDGLYLVEAPGKDRHDRVGNATNGLKLMAKRYDVPIIVSTQFNRGVDESDPKKITEKDIGITDVIAWTADFIAALFQTEDMRADNKMYIRVLKVRDGTPKDFESTWDFEHMDFRERCSDGFLQEQDDRIPRPLPECFKDDMSF